MGRERLVSGWLPVGFWVWSGLGFLLSIWEPGAVNMGAGIGVAALLFTVLWLLS